MYRNRTEEMYLGKIDNERNPGNWVFRRPRIQTAKTPRIRVWTNPDFANVVLADKTPAITSRPATITTIITPTNTLVFTGNVENERLSYDEMRDRPRKSSNKPRRKDRFATPARELFALKMA